MEEKKNVTGLVLCGGSIRGIYHLGALFYLQEKGELDNITHYACSSVGGFIAFLLSIGYKVHDIFCYTIQTDFSIGFETPNIPLLLKSYGLFPYKVIEHHMRKLTIDKLGSIPTLAQLHELTKKTLIFTTVNRTKCIVEYISHDNYPDLDIITALRMSSNLPLVFDSCIYNDNVYLDGSIGDDYPIDHLEKVLPEGNIIAILLKQKLGEKDENIISYLNSIIQLSFMLKDEKVIHKSSSRVRNYIIDIDGGTLDFKMNTQTKIKCFLNGYMSVKKQKNDIQGDMDSCIIL